MNTMKAHAFRLFCVAVSALGALLTALPATAAETAAPAPVLVTPPAPEMLAGMLFAKRYRDARGVSQASPRLVEMMIHFDFDSTRILPQSLPLLDSLGQTPRLERTQGESLVIEGHTDASGGERLQPDAVASAAPPPSATPPWWRNFEVKAERLISVWLRRERP